MFFDEIFKSPNYIYTHYLLFVGDVLVPCQWYITVAPLFLEFLCVPVVCCVDGSVFCFGIKKEIVYAHF